MPINSAVPQIFKGLGNALISLPKMATAGMGTIATTVGRGVGHVTGLKDLEKSSAQAQRQAVDAFQGGARQLGTGVKGTLDGVGDIFVP